jgi:putative ABC transport system permease protein
MIVKHFLSQSNRFSSIIFFLWLYRVLIVRENIRHPLRAVFLTTCIALAVSVFLAILYSTQASLSAFKSSVSTLGGAFNYEVLSSKQFINEDDVKEIVPVLDEHFDTFLISKINGTLKTSYEESGSENKQKKVPITLLGIDISKSEMLFNDRTSSRVPGIDNTKTSNKQNASEGVYIIEAFAVKHSLKKNSTLTLIVGDQTYQVNVAGVLQQSDLLVSDNTMIVDIGYLQEFLGTTLRYTSIGLKEREERKEDQFHDVFHSVLPKYLKTISNEENQKRGDDLLHAFRSNIFVMTLLALLVAVFTIYNASRINSFILRRKISLFKTLGATSFECFWIMLFESFVIGVLGSLVGIIFGYPLTKLISNTFLSTAQKMYIPNLFLNTVSVREVVLLYGGALFIGTVIAVGGSIVPVYQSIKGSPGYSLRSSSEISIQFKKRDVVAGLLFFVVTLLAVYGSMLFEDVRLAYISAISLIVSNFFLVPVIFFLFIRLLKKNFKRMSVTTLLAFGRLEGALKSCSIAVSVVGISVALLIAISVLITSFRESLISWIDYTFVADLYIKPSIETDVKIPTYLSEEIVSYVSSSPNVSVLYYTSFLSEIEGKRRNTVSIGGVSLDIGVRFSIYNLLKGEISQNLLYGTNEVIISENASKRLKLQVGDTVTIFGQQCTIGAIFKDFTKEWGSILMNRSMFQKLTQINATESVSLFFDDRHKNTLQIYQRRFQDTFDHYAVTILDNREIKSLIHKIFNDTFSITGLIRSIVALICSLGFLLSFLLDILQRQEQFTYLKKIGVKYGEVIFSIFKEGVLLITPGLIAGALTGIALSWILVAVINPASFGWTLNFMLKPNDIMFPIFLLLLTNCIAIILCAAYILRR